MYVTDVKKMGIVCKVATFDYKTFFSLNMTFSESVGFFAVCLTKSCSKEDLQMNSYMNEYRVREIQYKISGITFRDNDVQLSQ